MDPSKLLAPGCSPAQIHNAIASIIVGIYGPLLDQQQRTIDLLQQQLNQARKPPVAALQPELDELKERLRLTVEDRHKFYDKARVYGAIAAEYQRALEELINLGTEGVASIAKRALEWRHSNGDGVPRAAVEIMNDLLGRPVAAPQPGPQ